MACVPVLVSRETGRCYGCATGSAAFHNHIWALVSFPRLKRGMLVLKRLRHSPKTHGLNVCFT